VYSYPEYPRFLRFRGFDEAMQNDPSTADRPTGFDAFKKKLADILDNIYCLLLKLFGFR
jgi:hypothetical protein